MSREDAAMQFGDAARQAQSNAESTLDRVRGAGGLGEELEDISQRFAVHAYSSVAHTDNDMASQLSDAEGDVPAFVSVLRGIVEKVGQ